ncbi:hypothetical protein MXD63_18965 [Frankia sp. Cpl3]|nr:hypothetical protein [Frankia sp. Cpl3]
MHGLSGHLAMTRGPQEARDQLREKLVRNLVKVPRGLVLKETQANRGTMVRICAVELADGIAAGQDSDHGKHDVRLENPGVSGPDADQIEAVASLITRNLWPELRGAIDETSAESGIQPAAVRRELASHAWCDLIVGIIKLLEETNGLLGDIEKIGRDRIVHAMTDSSMQETRTQVNEKVIELMAGRVWSALFTAVKQAMPPLNVLDNDALLRTLRILAVFICPAPQKHKEVHIHALRPLGEDVRGYLTEQTKEHLKEAFADWGTWSTPSTVPGNGTG